MSELPILDIVDKMAMVFTIGLFWVLTEVGLYMVHPGWAIAGFGLAMLWIFGAKHD